MSSYLSLLGRRRRTLLLFLVTGNNSVRIPKPFNPRTNFDHVYHHSFFTRHPFSSETTAAKDNTSLQSSKVSYLVTNFGFSQKSAILFTRKFKLRPERAESVIQILSDLGISNADIIKDVVLKYPPLLAMNPRKTLKGKLDCLRHGGLSESEIVEILIKNPQTIFCCNLKEKFIPFFRYIETIFPSRNDVLNFLMCNKCQLPGGEVANIEILRGHGTPETIIARLCRLIPRLIFTNSKRFAEAAQQAREFGFDPSKVLFVSAVGILSIMKKSTWERRCALFRSFGFSSEEVILFFKRKPHCLALSDELIEKKLNFFTKQLGWHTRTLLSCPTLFTFSLNRIIPRCSVLNVLMSKDLIKKETSVGKYLLISANEFRSSFVENYVDKAPEVVEAYEGKLPFEGWSWKLKKTNRL